MNDKNFIIPDWTNSNLNISATLAEFLGVPNKNVILPILKNELAKQYKNVVFICFDGLGINPINTNLDENDFLRKNIKQTLVSTFPSTTTNATSSLLQNQLPLEHGWFGWSMNFKDMNKNIDIFMNTDSWTNEKVEIEKSPLGNFNYYFDSANSDYQINSIFPRYVKVRREDRNNIFSNMTEFVDIIKKICIKKEKQFIYAYYPDPDSTMHKYGITSKETHKVINNISANMQKLYKETRNTLFVITADHGQVDIEGYVELYKDKKLMDMLEIYPFMEARAPAFIVKNGKHAEFENYFTQTYGKDFELHKSIELIKKGYFGNVGDKGHLLGDYIAIGTYTHKQAILAPLMPKLKGHHGSLTEEMKVPLIIFNN